MLAFKALSQLLCKNFWDGVIRRLPRELRDFVYARLCPSKGPVFRTSPTEEPTASSLGRGPNNLFTQLDFSTDGDAELHFWQFDCVGEQCFDEAVQRLYQQSDFEVIDFSPHPLSQNLEQDAWDLSAVSKDLIKNLVIVMDCEGGLTTIEGIGQEAGVNRQFHFQRFPLHRSDFRGVEGAPCSEGHGPYTTYYSNAEGEWLPSQGRAERHSNGTSLRRVMAQRGVSVDNKSTATFTEKSRLLRL
ncbi:hypothetical protein BDV96DRAFT_657594 [Lophiotrema nucula]|uniref:Uncharacterized protein n=1 Tax=Lophiotrema nucula TaxID=690887 RepID=A0A6A5ZEU5_9PLEO|nr:hypothetical protein BDV96DRAFT_657594 [Lophiotrema nucula]